VVGAWGRGGGGGGEQVGSLGVGAAGADQVGRLGGGQAGWVREREKQELIR
jgi:hypothetical protein